MFAEISAKIRQKAGSDGHSLYKPLTKCWRKQQQSMRDQVPHPYGLADDWSVAGSHPRVGGAYVVVPERTPAGYRLYSDEDVALLQGAQRLVQRGIAPMEVAQLPRAQLKKPGAAVHEPSCVPSVIGSYSEHVERIVAAFARFNQAEAEGLCRVRCRCCCRLRPVGRSWCR